MLCWGKAGEPAGLRIPPELRSPASLGVGEDAVRGQGEKAGYCILGTARNTDVAEGLSRLSVSSIQLCYFCRQEIKGCKCVRAGCARDIFPEDR